MLYSYCHTRGLKYFCMMALLAGTLLRVDAADNFLSWDIIDFDESMQVAKYPRELALTQHLIGVPGDELYAFFKDVYVRHCFTLPEIGNTPRIPKIIHHIWLGSPVPQELKKIMNSWGRHHHGWRYKLWTDEDLKKFPLHNRELYEASTNYGQKSDIARYEILYQMGGLYVDVDTECLKSLDALHYIFDFYIGIQPLDSQFLQFGTGIIGAAQHHPLLKEIILGIQKNAKTAQGIPAKTGPIYVTKMFFAHANTYGLRDVALPPTYFYPLGAFEKNMDYADWLSKGAFAVHHWAKTWMPAKYRKPEFRTIQNYASTETWNG